RHGAAGSADLLRGDRDDRQRTRGRRTEGHVGRPERRVGDVAAVSVASVVAEDARRRDEGNERRLQLPDPRRDRQRPRRLGNASLVANLRSRIGQIKGATTRGRIWSRGWVAPARSSREPGPLPPERALGPPTGNET